MAYLLRIAKQNRWLTDETEDEYWVNSGTAPADIAADFGTDENKLSLWRVDDTDANNPHLKRVVLALVGNRENLKHFEYVLFDEEVLEQSGVENKDIDGEVLDPEVVPFHVDVDVGDINGLAHFLKFVWFSSTRIPRRVQVEELVKLSFDAFNEGTFKSEYCKPAVIKELQKKWEKLPSPTED